MKYNIDFSNEITRKYLTWTGQVKAYEVQTFKPEKKDLKKEKAELFF